MEKINWKLARECWERGESDAIIADKLGVSQNTVKNWRSAQKLSMNRARHLKKDEIPMPEVGQILLCAPDWLKSDTQETFQRFRAKVIQVDRKHLTYTVEYLDSNLKETFRAI